MSVDKAKIRRELWYARQQLYLLYELEHISEWRARDLLALNDLIEEYNLLEVLEDIANKRERLYSTKLEIESRIREADKRDYKRKGLLVKKLDKVLTLIALVEADEMDRIDKIITTYKLLNRNDKGLLKALEEIDSKGYDHYKSIIDNLKQDIEREIIELKKIEYSRE